MPTHIGNISFGGRNLSDEEAAAVAARFAEQDRKEAERKAQWPAIHERGEAALRRLLPLAQGNTGQCRHVAAFLLSLYNGSRFTFDLTDFRCVDKEIFDDCMAVLQMDRTLLQEVHLYFPNGGKLFEDLAVMWRIPDRTILRSIIADSELPKIPDYDTLRQIRTDYLDSRAS